ncbi:TRAP transporter small permease subunit [Telmatospirillum sp. J64-1]|uniref:TRAP transporter small permease subunit n=1 Tax=Telmatospirillum sp. J64-1 TaxID=2502183 RepID=UPI00163DA4D4|nr:TRAP transporter small permease [Telmatospirillum sp. J64-1]
MSVYLAALALALIFLLVSFEVVTRSFFGFSVQFTWEYAGYLAGAVTFLAAGPALERGAHVRITLLLDHLSPRARDGLDIFATLVSAAIVGLLLYAFATMTLQSWRNGTVASTPMLTPLVIPQTVMLAGIVIFEIQLFARIARILCGYPADLARASVLDKD